MHRVIIPVDFSETSLNASRYAAKMLSGKDDSEAILFHNFETHDDVDISHNFLESLKKEFYKSGVKNVTCENELGGNLVDNISKLAHTSKSTLILMGITGKSAVRQALFGSNTLKLIDKNIYPVMIIPPDATYKGINNVAFASDLKNVEETTPFPLINAVLEIFNPKLHIVHIHKEQYKNIPTEIEEQKEILLKMFKNYEKECHFINMHDFYKAMDNVILNLSIDFLVTVPKHRSNATSIFKTTHTKKLAYHSHIPILAAHE